MEKNVDKIIKNVEESALDKPTATLVISSKSDKLFFIGEALLLAAGVALLHSYLAGLFGVEQLAENHRKKIQSYWKKIWEGNVSEDDSKEAKELAQATLNMMDETKISEVAKRNAEIEVEKVLLDEGATRANATSVSIAITTAIFQEDGKAN